MKKQIKVAAMSTLLLSSIAVPTVSYAKETVAVNVIVKPPSNVGQSNKEFYLQEVERLTEKFKLPTKVKEEMKAFVTSFSDKTTIVIDDDANGFSLRNTKEDNVIYTYAFYSKRNEKTLSMNLFDTKSNVDLPNVETGKYKYGISTVTKSDFDKFVKFSGLSESENLKIFRTLRTTKFNNGEATNNVASIDLRMRIATNFTGDLTGNGYLAKGLLSVVKDKSQINYWTDDLLNYIKGEESEVAYVSLVNNADLYIVQRDPKLKLSGGDEHMYIRWSWDYPELVKLRKNNKAKYQEVVNSFIAVLDTFKKFPYDKKELLKYIDNYTDESSDIYNKDYYVAVRSGDFIMGWY